MIIRRLIRPMENSDGGLFPLRMPSLKTMAESKKRYSRPFCKNRRPCGISTH